ncbi:histidine utilization repressor [Maribrevibacterium harenarium]|uniref:Histidine utilization repressor n=1 Tax=Maribrevibacterium harenarium TaxID=2589817 RepID=A0A501WXY5_9GAMM|nr:histidine utilization repressor [Maribrevibacterium harenarium]TPE53360.1 histidine utilization repressor [Maribrevibacterium harenarium]
MADSTPSLLDNFFSDLPDTPAPIYARLKQAIAHKVASGQWQPNQRVPSEAEWVKALNVSRMTVNRALRELTAEGVLTRQQGLGTFVAQKKAHSALFEVHNIAEEVASRGGVYRAEQLQLLRGKATVEEAVNLGIRTNQEIFRSVILHFENDLPIQLEERTVNAVLAPDYGAQDFTRQTPYVYLMQAAPMTEGEHLVEAVLPNERECDLLQISESEPCLQIKRRTWSGDQIVTAARLLHPGSRFQLFGHFSR